MTANIVLQRAAYPGITSDRYGGTACTGTNKTANRELFVSNGVSIITVDRSTLVPNDDYTESGGTVTFSIPIDNRHKIVIFR